MRQFAVAIDVNLLEQINHLRGGNGAYFGFKLVLQVKDRIGIILGSAIVFVLGLQALLNMGVVLGLLPTKGLNLPFISYGGSSLVCNFFGIGLLLSVVKGYRDQLQGNLKYEVRKNTDEEVYV